MGSLSGLGFCKCTRLKRAKTRRKAWAEWEKIVMVTLPLGQLGLILGHEGCLYGPSRVLLWYFEGSLGDTSLRRYLACAHSGLEGKNEFLWTICLMLFLETF